jgi:hypothetical protein
MGILFPQKFEVIFTNEMYVISPKKVLSTNDRGSSCISQKITEVEDIFLRNVTLKHEIGDVTGE